MAAIALGLHHLGVMGRLLKEGIDQQGKNISEAINCIGANPQTTWLYGCLSKQSSSYLAYGAYRTDVILRETAVVGMVGGTGLGWQIREALSSFDWAQVSVLIVIYILIMVLINQGWINI